jgi:hypothetical protein
MNLRGLTPLASFSPAPCALPRLAASRMTAMRPAHFLGQGDGFQDETAPAFTAGDVLSHDRFWRVHRRGRRFIFEMTPAKGGHGAAIGTRRASVPSLSSRDDRALNRVEFASEFRHTG